MNQNYQAGVEWLKPHQDRLSGFQDKIDLMILGHSFIHEYKINLL
jgi:hypothetical protein